MRDNEGRNALIEWREVKAMRVETDELKIERMGFFLFF